MNYQEKSFYERSAYINNNLPRTDYTDACIRGANKLDEMHQSLNEITQKTTNGYKTAMQARNGIINESSSSGSSFKYYSNHTSSNKPVEQHNNYGMNANLANKRNQLDNMNALSNRTIL